MQVRTLAAGLVGVAACLASAAGCGDEGSGNVEAFCATARRFEVANPALVFSTVDPADQPATARALRNASGELGAWAEEAPSDVRADVERVRDAAADLAAVFEAPAVDTAALAALEASASEVESASARLVAAVRTTCEVDLEAAPPPTTASG